MYAEYGDQWTENVNQKNGKKSDKRRTRKEMKEVEAERTSGSKKRTKNGMTPKNEEAREEHTAVIGTATTKEMRIAVDRRIMTTRIRGTIANSTRSTGQGGCLSDDERKKNVSDARAC